MNQDWIEILNYVIQNNNTNDIINIEESIKNVNLNYLNWLAVPPMDINQSSSDFFENIHKIILNSLVYKNILIQDYTIIPKNRAAELLLGINVLTVEMSNDLKILEFFSINKINFLSQVIMESNYRIDNLINTLGNISIETREDCLNIFTQKCTHFLRLSGWGNVVNPHICSNLQINNSIRFGLLFDEYIKMKSINPNINFSKLTDFYLTEWNAKWLGKEKIRSEIATLSGIVDNYQSKFDAIEKGIDPSRRQMVNKQFLTVIEENRNIVNFNSYMNILDNSREREVVIFCKKK